MASESSNTSDTTNRIHRGGQDNTFRVLTQNVWCHYPMTFVSPCSHAMAGYPCQSRLELLAAHIIAENYDVVCLQELFVWRVWPMSDQSANFDFMVRRLGSAGYVHHTNPLESLCENRWIGQNSGVVIFSRHPLERAESIRFLHTSENHNTKGFVVADVRFPVHTSGASVSNNRGDAQTDRIVRLVSAHLDARTWSTKQTQVTQIANHLKKKQETTDTALVELVVCGDLNICPEPIFDDGTYYAHLTSTFGSKGLGLFSAWTPPNNEATHADGTLDHIFFRKNAWELEHKSVVRVVDTVGKSVSNHFGLEVHLRPIDT
eukprot:m.196467 g.196467  ORF g.196467 m.196467 type:complete len:318 (-) comp32620_c10_seq1:76-1029(-)